MAGAELPLIRTHRIIDQRELAHLFKEVLQETGVAKPLYVTMGGQVHIKEMEEFRQKWEALEGDGPGRKKLAEDNAKQVVLRRTVGAIRFPSAICDLHI